MKVYLLTEDDFRQLLAAVDRDPRRGFGGGSSMVLSAVEANAHEQAHAFFNYQVRTWLDRVKADR